VMKMSALCNPYLGSNSFKLLPISLSFLYTDAVSVTGEITLIQY
jgi:hypothetical protein